MGGKLDTVPDCTTAREQHVLPVLCEGQVRERQAMQVDPRGYGSASLIVEVGAIREGHICGEGISSTDGAEVARKLYGERLRSTSCNKCQCGTWGECGSRAPQWYGWVE